MRKKLSPLLLFEVSALIATVIFAVTMVVRTDGEHDLTPITAEALATGPGHERWFGFFLEENHVGFSVNRTSPATMIDDDEIGTLYEQRSSFRIPVSGTIQHVVTASAALVNSNQDLVRFDFFMSTDLVVISARGQVLENEIEVELVAAGETEVLRFPIDEPPHVALSLQSVVQAMEMRVGQRFSVPFFDPATMSQGTMNMTVDDVEVLSNGEEAWWISTDFMGAQMEALMTSAGEIVRQEGSLGLSLRRMTAEEAQNIPTADQAVDLISLAAAPLEGNIRRPRFTDRLTLRVSGVEPEQMTHQPPLQRVVDNTIQIERANLSELPDLPVADLSESEWLGSTWTLTVGHEEIRAKALEVVGDARTRVEAVQRLVDFVDNHVENVPNIGVPHGLAVLRNARGDCNEHTTLFVSLARAAGIPSRIVAGLVYSIRAGTHPAFYYHAWPEVRLGGDMDWIPVDPTFGQFPADATHIKLVEGDLDRQVEIMSFMGRIGFGLVEVE